MSTFEGRVVYHMNISSPFACLCQLRKNWFTNCKVIRGSCPLAICELFNNMEWRLNFLRGSNDKRVLCPRSVFRFIKYYVGKPVLRILPGNSTNRLYRSIDNENRYHVKETTNRLKSRYFVITKPSLHLL